MNSFNLKLMLVMGMLVSQLAWSSQSRVAHFFCEGRNLQSRSATPQVEPYRYAVEIEFGKPVAKVKRIPTTAASASNSWQSISLSYEESSMMHSRTYGAYPANGPWIIEFIHTFTNVGTLSISERNSSKVFLCPRFN